MPSDGFKMPPPREVWQRRACLIRALFLNRVDILAHQLGKKPCPVEAGDNLDALLESHLTGKKVRYTWRAGCEEDGNLVRKDEYRPVRLGTYCPTTDGLTTFACLDFDGSGHTAPLADPLGSALRVWLLLLEHGLVAHLERSKSGKGWHLWIVFGGPVSASRLRAALLQLLPADLPLATGGFACWRSNLGVELFPKSDRAPRLGNQVYLPWWSGAAPGCNEFYRENDDGLLQPFDPVTLATTPAGRVDELHARLVPPAEPKKPATAPRPGGGARTAGSTSGPSGMLDPIDWISRRSRTMTRHNLGKLFALQLRDNRYTEAEALAFTREFLGLLSEGDHPYTASEFEKTVKDIYRTPPREAWTSEDPGSDQGGDQTSCLTASDLRRIINKEEVVSQTQPPERLNRVGTDDFGPSTRAVMLAAFTGEPCPQHSTPLLQRHDKPRVCLALRADCRTFGCAPCGARKCGRWLSHLLVKFRAVDAPLHLGTVGQGGPYANLTRRVNRRGADFAAVDTRDGLATVVASADAPGLEPSPVADATEAVASALLHVRLGRGRKDRPVKTSAGWALHEPRRRGSYRRRGMAGVGAFPAVVATLERKGLNPVVTDVEDDRGERCDWLAPPDWSEEHLDVLFEVLNCIGRDIRTDKDQRRAPG